jgi:nitroreductase
MHKKTLFWSAVFLFAWMGPSLSPALAADAGMPQTEPDRTITSPQQTYTPEQQYLFDLFHKRRSVRRFKPTPVPREHILKILDMARSAPTSGNQQPWKFLVIQDPDTLASIRDACIKAAMERAKQRPGQDAERLEKQRQRQTQYFSDYLSAPVYVVVLVDTNSRYPSYNVYDGALAAGYLMIAARALGYGTVFSQDSIPYPILREVLDIPEQFERICFTPIGVPETWPESPKKKLLEDFVVFEKFVPGENYTVKIVRKAIELETSLLQEYEGEYQLTPEISLKISREDSRMFAEATGQARVEIFAEANGKFFLNVTNAQITFTRDEAGTVTGLIWHQGGRDLKGSRIEKQKG